MFKKILVPLDGSELAAKIIPQVIDLATTHLAEVTLLHVAYTEYGEAQSWNYGSRRWPRKPNVAPSFSAR